MSVLLVNTIVPKCAPTLTVVSIVLVIKVIRYWLIEARVKVRLIMIGSLQFSCILESHSTIFCHESEIFVRRCVNWAIVILIDCLIQILQHQNQQHQNFFTPALEVL